MAEDPILLPPRVRRKLHEATAMASQSQNPDISLYLYYMYVNFKFVDHPKPGSTDKDWPLHAADLRGAGRSLPSRFTWSGRFLRRASLGHG